MRSGSIDHESLMKENVNFMLDDNEKVEFTKASNLKGYLKKKSPNFLKGWQKRLFAVRCKKGFYLSYGKDESDLKGVLEIGKMNTIKPKGKNEFDIEYDGQRTFELRADNTTERDNWVKSLNFLRDMRDKLGSQIDTARSQSQAYFNSDSFVSSRRGSSSTSFSGKESWKVSNLDKEAMLGVIDEEEKEVVYQEATIDDKKLSEIALDKKGILTYIEDIPLKKRKSRMMYGFLRKRGRGKLGLDHKRWCFMISSRPLNQDDYLNDNDMISDDQLPPLIEFDCMYYYSMSDKDDSSPSKGVIKVMEIDKIEEKTEGKFHSMFIDAGPKKYEFMSTTKFLLQQWIEALELAKRTANEKLYSITGSIKNISKIVTQFEIDADLLADELSDEARAMFPHDYKYESIEELLDKCTKLSQEFFSIFDA